MKGRKIGVVGLGYVGLPLAVSFGKVAKVIGFDINEIRIEQLKKGIDHTNEVESYELLASSVKFTANPMTLQQCDYIIIAVPTPINDLKLPDLTPIIQATKTVAKYFKKGTTVIYESTVYPGLTEEECIPVLEQYSKFTAGKDFFVGYSPERINPGDKVHTFENIVKVVSGQTPEVAENIANLYRQVVKAGVHVASSIKVAEAAKVVENTQRDVNIALMNEFALIFNKLNINTADVLKAASTKWNFLDFTPGFVGGHCIGVDPYYLAYKAQEAGITPNLLLMSRNLNEEMPAYITNIALTRLRHYRIAPENAVVTVLGITFKENVPDIRNTKVIDLIQQLQAQNMTVQVHDPYADPQEVRHHLGISLRRKEQLQKSDVVILAVAHDEYCEQAWDNVTSLLKRPDGFVIDLKGCLDKEAKPTLVAHWNL